MYKKNKCIRLNQVLVNPNSLLIMLNTSAKKNASDKTLSSIKR